MGGTIRAVTDSDDVVSTETETDSTGIDRDRVVKLAETVALFLVLGAAVTLIGFVTRELWNSWNTARLAAWQRPFAYGNPDDVGYAVLVGSMLIVLARLNGGLHRVGRIASVAVVVTAAVDLALVAGYWVLLLTVSDDVRRELGSIGGVGFYVYEFGQAMVVACALGVAVHSLDWTIPSIRKRNAVAIAVVPFAFVGLGAYAWRFAERRDATPPKPVCVHVEFDDATTDREVAAFAGGFQAAGSDSLGFTAGGGEMSIKFRDKATADVFKRRTPQDPIAPVQRVVEVPCRSASD